MLDGSGSGTSTSSSALSGPDSRTIWMARIARIMSAAAFSHASAAGCGHA